MQTKANVATAVRSRKAARAFDAFVIGAWMSFCYTHKQTKKEKTSEIK